MSGWVPGAQWLTDKLIGILDKFVEIPNSDVLRVGVLKGLVKLEDVVSCGITLRGVAFASSSTLFSALILNRPPPPPETPAARAQRPRLAPEA